MRKYWIVTLEPLEQRYSKQWYNMFKEVLGSKGAEFEYIDGVQIRSELKGELFLDPVATHVWKFSQLGQLVQKDIKDGDVVFFFDYWFPGVEALAYIRDMTGKDFKIWGYLHAGSYDEWDILAQKGMWKWGKKIEEGWFRIADKLMVATQFHKELILRSRCVEERKIEVVRFPLDIAGMGKCIKPKKKQIVFTGRKSVEKGYELIKLLKREYPIIVSLDETKTKKEYYDLLGESKAVIAPSFQETFGVGIVEGMAMDCIPIVPDRLAYRETVPDEYRVKDTRGEWWGDYIERALESEDVRLRDGVRKYQYQAVISKMLEL